MNLDDIDSASLDHSGVKGMRWGVRKPRNEKARAAQFGPKKPIKLSSDYKATQPYRGRDPRSLSNKQLKALNERMNLESNYARLNPSTKKKNEQRAKELMGTIGLGVGLYNLVKTPAGKAAIDTGKVLLEMALNPALKKITNNQVP